MAAEDSELRERTVALLQRGERGERGMKGIKVDKDARETKETRDAGEDKCFR
jgi:hypothetical protein